MGRPAIAWRRSWILSGAPRGAADSRSWRRWATRFASGRGIAGRVLAAFDAVPVHVISRAPGANHLACVVDQSDLAFAVETLHACLFECRASCDEGDPASDLVVAPQRAFRGTSQELRA